MDYLSTYVVSNSYAIQSVTSEELNDKGDSEVSQKLLEKIIRAAHDGFFYMEIPENIKKTRLYAEAFVNSFYTNEEIKNMELPYPKQCGYHAGENVQREFYSVPKSHWVNPYLPGEELQQFVKETDEVARKILMKVFEAYKIPKEHWDMLSGGLTSNKGEAFINFLHYRSSINGEGVLEHKDGGSVTCLYTSTPGLQAKMQNKTWVHIPPREGYMVINFGKTLEILINRPDFSAAEHRVVKTNNERTSIALFTHQNLNSTLFQMVNGVPQVFNASYHNYAVGEHEDAGKSVEKQ